MVWLEVREASVVLNVVAPHEAHSASRQPNRQGEGIISWLHEPTIVTRNLQTLKRVTNCFTVLKIIVELVKHVIPSLH